jgi:hypothetical protein
MTTRKSVPLGRIATFGLGFLLLTSPAFAQTAASVGALQGRVTDPQGNPLAGAQVRYARAVKTVVLGKSLLPAPGEALVRGTVSTDATGGFALTDLTPGNYALCGQVPSAAYLDPCIWQQPVAVTVSAGATATPSLVLTKGVFLKVRVNDPMGLLPQAVDGIWTPRKLLVGVIYASGAYRGAENTSVDLAGRDYQLVIPSGMPFSLRMFSNHVALTHQSGTTANATALAGTAVDMTGSQIPFQAAADQDQAFAFAVSGPASQSQ